MLPFGNVRGSDSRRKLATLASPGEKWRDDRRGKNHDKK